MSNQTNIRELILNILIEINQAGEYSHIAIRNTLDKYLFLPKQERAFITRVCEGTMENRIQLDYIIEQFSSVPVAKMKPVVREILRSAVYQLRFMDSVPDSAVCNEAVKLAQKKGFYSLKGFVNGVLRNIARGKEQITFPDREKEPVKYLVVRYSIPEWIVQRWVLAYGMEVTEKMCRAFLEEKPTTIRLKTTMTDTGKTLESLREQGVKVEKAPYVEEAYYISGYNYLLSLEAFKNGWFQVQDVSSMIAGEAAAPEKGNYVIDLCAAPGGKSLHIADKMQNYGHVEARDLTEYKVGLIEDNIRRADLINIEAVQKDATVYDPASEEKADLVIADLPCSGLGVMGKKTDIKYKVTPARQEELVILQRKILHHAASYVKPGGVLLYSTCTIAEEENQDNVNWFKENYPFELESLDPYLCEELHSETTAQGWLQLIPGIHSCDGFFVARLRKKEVTV